MHVVRSEWAKLVRRGMLLGAALLVVLAMLGAVLVFSNAREAPAANPDGPGGLSFARLAEPDGLIVSLLFIGQVIGAVSMVLFARSAGNDYTNGTLKTALGREPRRVVFLAGKAIALGAFVTIAVVVGFAAMAGVASAVAAGRGMDTSQWWTGEGLMDALGGLARLVAASLAWGLIGMALGVVTRSGSLAVGIGVPFLGIGEHLMQMVWNDGARWMPGIVLAVFAAGGTRDMGLGLAGLLTIGYAIAFAAVAWGTFARRDVN
jgi:ABC-type transport system involved in multi-copper enzyme maturation permease subunit